MKTIVAFGPHPDDIELGLGGYIAKLRRLKEDTLIRGFVIAQGDASHEKKFLRNGQNIGRDLEQRHAAKAVGIDNVVLMAAAPDGSMHLTPRRELVSKIQYALSQCGPVDEVFIPLPSFHQDHQTVFDACISALRPRAGFTLPNKVYAYEYPGNSWGPSAAHLGGKTYVKLQNDDVGRKFAALEEHASQWVADEDAPLIGKRAVRSLLGMRGAEVGCEWAEMFHLLREVHA